MYNFISCAPVFSQHITVHYNDDLFSIFTSFSHAPIIITVKIWDKILRSCLLGAVVELASVLGNYVIEALTSDVFMTCLHAFRADRCPHFLESVVLQHHTKGRIFTATSLCRSHTKLLAKGKQSRDANLSY